jgi:hypothetical protein
MGMPFKFDIAFEAFEKAEDGDRSRKIGGIVSTNHLDRQQEVLIQEGLDFTPFLKSGWFNDNHDTATDSVVGYPERAELRELPDGKQGWYVEGFLLKGSERAEKIWNLANALQKTDRRLGFSVEGKILERDEKNPKLVHKAQVREVAITKCPVNENTSLMVLAKSLSVGGAVPLPRNVAVPGPAGGGRLLSPQSLEANKNPPPDKKKRKRKLAKAEAVRLLMKAHPRIHQRVAKRIVEYAMRWHPAT